MGKSAGKLAQLRSARIRANLNLHLAKRQFRSAIRVRALDYLSEARLPLRRELLSKTAPILKNVGKDNDNNNMRIRFTIAIVK